MPIRYGIKKEKTWVNEPVDVTKVLQRAALVCDPLAKSSGIKIRSLAITDAPFADANGDRLCQVFINLISNAIKYNDSKDPYVELSMKRVGKRLQIEFQDNGPGIALKDRKRVGLSYSSITQKSNHNEQTSFAIYTLL